HDVLPICFRAAVIVLASVQSSVFSLSGKPSRLARCWSAWKSVSNLGSPLSVEWSIASESARVGVQPVIMVELTQRVTLNSQRALRVPSASHAGSPSTQSTFFGEAGAGGLLAGASMTAMQSVEAEPPPPTTTATDERTPAAPETR